MLPDNIVKLLKSKDWDDVKIAFELIKESHPEFFDELPDYDKDGKYYELFRASDKRSMGSYLVFKYKEDFIFIDGQCRITKFFKGRRHMQNKAIEL